MAGLWKRGKFYTLRIVLPNGRRKAIGLGTASERIAVTAKLKIEDLLAAKGLGQTLNPATLQWLKECKPAITKKLAAWGLVEAAMHELETQPTNVAELIKHYIDIRSDVKDGTLNIYQQVQRNLIDFVSTKPLASISKGDAEEFRLWLASHEKLASNTVRRRCAIARQFFRHAVRKQWITENPFEELKGLAVKGNKQRDHYVTREETEKILAMCPDYEWRLLVALARYGGLRTPSESLELKWTDIDWQNKRLTVRSPKLERYEGKGTRVIPIFPELMPYLQEAWDAVPKGQQFVITRYRTGKYKNPGTHLKRIMLKAGLTPWAKPWQNMRASRATELTQDYPGHVAAVWLGHSVAVAEEHYWQVTEEDFKRATVAINVPQVCQQGTASSRTKEKSIPLNRLNSPILAGNGKTSCPFRI